MRLDREPMVCQAESLVATRGGNRASEGSALRRLGCRLRLVFPTSTDMLMLTYILLILRKWLARNHVYLSPMSLAKLLLFISAVNRAGLLYISLSVKTCSLAPLMAFDLPKQASTETAIASPTANTTTIRGLLQLATHLLRKRRNAMPCAICLGNG